MKTIIIANQKGGSGKSTLTVHLAVAAGLAGDGPVAVTDTDPQGTTAGWFNDREAAERAFWGGEPCMKDCKPPARVTGRAAVLDVTPDSKSAPKVD